MGKHVKFKIIGIIIEIIILKIEFYWSNKGVNNKPIKFEIIATIIEIVTFII